jgi:hypothetical protein
MRGAKSLKRLTVNLCLLRCFREPISPYEVLKHCGVSYPGIHRELGKFQDLGLVTLAYTGKSSKGGLKKFFVLSKKGRILLALFSEDGQEDDALLEAV